MEEISPTPETSDPLELAGNGDEKAEENGENGGIAKILDKRIVDDRETWYLVNWTDKKRENSWLESSEIEASQTAAIERFEEELAEKDPDEEFTLEKITDKRILSGVVYYYCKWLGFPDSDSTWEPCENIFAKNLIDDFEKEAENSKSAKKRKKSARQNDEDFTPEEDIPRLAFLTD
ncbi:Oidioi.mRNA.OKI2018_I69.XSR.g13421.t1.cds [Oikopleura dioica]|uniref:Oidioi.mRNA.OKI2018_I69.XSR.g13421.t1.cds n=1 Tax=Oikopleura dioica TaxID=34765 RepID=A0ABN7SCY2_OIKDI|nr:Oidioi.mRNA.OKI2018_I69.XSR.g13421.t1.cds [Oikopleura dioica]